MCVIYTARVEHQKWAAVNFWYQQPRDWKKPLNTPPSHMRVAASCGSILRNNDKDPLIHPRVPSPVWTRSFNLEHRLKLVFFLEAPYRIISVAINGQYDCHTIFTVWTSIRISPINPPVCIEHGMSGIPFMFRISDACDVIVIQNSLDISFMTILFQLPLLHDS